jgi:tripartite-type tricarboxylate transporter receptor subunit TctC
MKSRRYLFRTEAQPKLVAMIKTSLIASLALASSVALAQTYPSHAVKVIVPWPPGQATDIAARLLAAKLQQALNQPFVIDNRPGAGGSVGTAAAANSAPDGYTLLAASSGPISVMPSLQKLPYDPLRDLTMIGLITRSPYVLVVGAAFPAANLKELVALARANPDKYTFGSSGTGATGHLLAELFNSMAGIQARHVPYKGAGPELTDVIGGRVDYSIEVVAATVGHVRAGRLKALGVSTAQRATALPAVPTIAEAAGLPGYDAGVWIGYAAPAGLPRDVLLRLSGEMQKAMRSVDLRQRLLAAGLDPVTSTPEEIPAFMRREQERYAEVIRKANIRLED